MGMTTLYGTGAITVSDDRHTYRAHHGAIAVPEHLTAVVMGLGFSRTTPAAELEPEETTPVVEPIDASLSDEVLYERFWTEAVNAGYADDVPDTIARERLAHLRAGGSGFDRLVVPANAPELSDAAGAPAVADDATTTDTPAAS